MKKLLLLLLIGSVFQQVAAQTRLIPKFIRKMYFDQDSTRKSSFVVLPVLTSAPETGLDILRTQVAVVWYSLIVCVPPNS